MEYKLSKICEKERCVVHTIVKENQDETIFWLGLIILENDKIKEDVVHRNKVGKFQWRIGSGVLCDHTIHMELNGK